MDITYGPMIFFGVALFIESILLTIVISVLHDGKLIRSRIKEVLVISLSIGLIQASISFIEPSNGIKMFVLSNFLLLLKVLIIKRYINTNTLNYFCISIAIGVFNAPLSILMTIPFAGKSELFGAVFTIGSIIMLSLNILLMKKYRSSFLAKIYINLLDKSKYILAVFVIGSNYVQAVLLFKNMVRFEDNFVVVTIMSAVALIALLIITISLFIKESNMSESIKMQSNLLIDYTATIEELYDDIRSYKHDINNILIGIKYFVDQRDMDSIVSYFDKEINDVKSFDIKLYKILTQVHLLKIDALKGLILSKYQKSLVAGVDLHVGIDGTIENNSVNVVELCRVVGIYLDNAIEAAAESEEKNVLVYFENLDDKVLIKISNNYNHSSTVIINPKKNYSTKGDGRGIGLYSAQRIIKRNEKLELETKLENKMYSQLLYVLK